MGQKRLLAAPRDFLHSARKSLARGPKALKGVIDAQDIAEVAKLSSQAVLAWSLPERPSANRSLKRNRLPAKVKACVMAEGSRCALVRITIRR